LPDYEEFYLNQYMAPVKILPYSAAQGCYWRQCSFCPENAEDNSYRPQPLEEVWNNLSLLCSKNKPGLLHFLDNAISPARLTALAQKNPGAPWYGFARVTGHLADENFCRSLQRCGCVLLKLGIESGDQSVLDKLRKGIELKTAVQALKAVKKAGIFTYVYLLFGTPPEDEASAQKTLEFVIANRENIDFLNLAIFNLPLASLDAAQLVTHDFYEGDLSLYRAFRHPLGWQRSLVRRFLEGTFKKHPAVAAILRRNPEYFTSNHAPFFAGR